MIVFGVVEAAEDAHRPWAVRRSLEDDMLVAVGLEQVLAARRSEAVGRIAVALQTAQVAEPEQPVRLEVVGSKVAVVALPVLVAFEVLLRQSEVEGRLAVAADRPSLHLIARDAWIKVVFGFNVVVYDRVGT